jgi:hypothetical protein
MLGPPEAQRNGFSKKGGQDPNIPELSLLVLI